jgi:hypothetical protein
MKLQFIIASSILFFLTGWIIGCHSCRPKKITCAAATITTDTITRYIRIRDSTGAYKPPISKIVLPVRVNGKLNNQNAGRRMDTFILHEPIPTDTAAILALYDAEIYVNDTVNTDYGRIRINDILTRYKISSRQVFTDFQVPERIITKTITQKPKVHNEVWIGTVVQGNKLDPLNGLGATIAFKTKHAMQYQAAGIYGRGGIMNYQLGASFKISMRQK